MITNMTIQYSYSELEEALHYSDVYHAAYEQERVYKKHRILVGKSTRTGKTIYTLKFDLDKEN
jgi:hypothetical protein